MKEKDKWLGIAVFSFIGFVITLFIVMFT